MWEAKWGLVVLGKQLMETMARHYAARGKMHVICLRPTLIVRPEKEAQILAQLALPNPDGNSPGCSSNAASRNAVVPYGALSATRTYVRSTDAARGFLADC